MDRLGAHFRLKLVAVLFYGLQIVLFGQQLAAFQLGHARLDYPIGLEVQHPLDLTQGHVQQQAHARRQ